MTYLRPSQAQVALGLGFGPEDLEVAFSVGARYYGSIEALSDDASSGDVAGALAEQQVLLDLGVTPTVAIGPNARIRGGFTYTLGLIEPDAASASGRPPMPAPGQRRRRRRRRRSGSSRARS